MARSVLEVQSTFAASSVLRSEIMWDTLASDQFNILHQKIKTIIPDNEHSPGALKKQRKNLFQNIWSQRKYTNGILLSAIIYVLVTDEHDPELAIKSTLFSCHPVFRTRRCSNADDSTGCCMIFIDEHGRVYQNWHQFIRNNLLPKGLMIAPQNGVYTFNTKDEVELELHPTALTRSASKVLDTTDKVATVGGFAATVPIAAAVFFSFAAPVMATASAVVLTTTLYSTARSALHLVDRSRHEQSISCKDQVARKSWFGIAGGAVGLGAAGATKALTSAATAGSKISFGAKLAVNGINVSSMLLSGTSVVNGVFDLYIKLSDDEKIGNIDLMQLAASLLVFTHSMNNLRVASAVATCRTASSLRMELNKEIRSQFSKITMGSALKGKVDILRIFNDIPNTEALKSLHKGTNQSNVLLSGKNQTCDEIFELDFAQLEKQFGSKFIKHTANPQNLYVLFRTMRSHVSDCSIMFFLELTKQFLNKGVEGIDQRLTMYISTENVLYKIFMYCIRSYTNLGHEFLQRKAMDIMDAVEKEITSQQPENDGIPEFKCKHCNGHFYVCEL